MSDLWTLIIPLLSVWLIACLGIIFIKAGEGWWKTLIPIYREYILCKIVGNKFWIFPLLSLPIVLGIPYLILLIIVPPYGALGIPIDPIILLTYWVFVLFCIIYTVVFYIFIQIRLSKSFGKSNGFCVGMIFLPFVFAGILAFDSSTYDLKRLSGSENSITKVKDKTVKN